MALLTIQIVTTLITLGFSYYYFRFGFLFMFLVILNVLLVAPFFLIYFDLAGYVSVYTALHTRVDSKVTLAFDDSTRPVIYMILGQWSIFIGYLCSIAFLRRRRSKKSESIYELAPRERSLAAGVMHTLMWLCFSYLLIRFVLVPDFPILAFLLNGGNNLRDIAYAYGTSEGFYPFRPSIVQQFTRIGVPLIMLYSYVLWKNGMSKGIFVIAMVLLTVLLAIGTFKRTPIVYLVLWAFLFIAVLNPRFKMANIMKFGALAFAGTTFMTILYTHDYMEGLNSILTRIMIGEARGQYLAFLHYGTTIEFEHFNLAVDYARKVLGQDVMAFSERWKIVTGGTRGFTSIGAVAETYVSFGYAGLGLLVGYGIVLGQLDRLAMRYMTPVTRPIITGLIGVVAFSSTKGVLSQLFTGGTLFLLAALILAAAMTPRKAALQGYAWRSEATP